MQTGTFDVVIDTPGSDLECYRCRLTKNGRMVTVGLSASALAAIALSAVHRSRRIRTFSANPDTAILEDLAGYVPSGALRPVVTGVFRWPTSQPPTRRSAGAAPSASTSSP